MPEAMYNMHLRITQNAHERAMIDFLQIPALAFRHGMMIDLARIASSRFNRALNTSRFQPREIASKMNAAFGRGLFLDHPSSSDKAAIKGSKCKTGFEER